MPTECPFCALSPDRILYKDDQILIFGDGYPVSPGHMLVIPRRHVATWFDATEAERQSLVRGIERARELILEQYAPDGYNVGFNAGEAAGQTVFHLHVHIIPRYVGDVTNPRGGIRCVIPGKCSYPTGEPPFVWHAHASRRARMRPLVTGGETDPLGRLIRRHFETSTRVDVAVAFVMARGLKLVESELEGLVARGSTLRFLTGDYLDTTEPEALERLLELKQIGPRVDIRVFEARTSSFHPKAYIFRFEGGDGIAYIGSSNLTLPALSTGLEWNYELNTAHDVVGFRDVVNGFDALFQHRNTRNLDHEWIEAYRKRRASRPFVVPNPEWDSSFLPPQPHSVQSEALGALVRTRADGNEAGLVVLATGLGKTWLCAFDSARPEFHRILFVAHRREILRQARDAFTSIRPTASIGEYKGDIKNSDAEIVFALIQTIGRPSNLLSFDPLAFDYIIVDEFHHGSAPSYRRLIDHFRPKFLLGLTATPERTDGRDLLGLCGDNLVYRCDVWEGIQRGLLSPFHYFGVPDDVDFANIPWRNSRFDDEELTKALATEVRAENALEQYRLRAGRRTLAFCCSQRHADFMAEYFRQAGLRTAAVHSGPSSDERAESLRMLEAAELDVLFAVDMFNEGLDIPSIDTVMMLRPTESRIIWLQQFGRGLRRVDDKPHLTVVDYIGNHRAFLAKPRALLDLGTGAEEIRKALARYVAGTLQQELPPGCEVTYDLKAVDILRALVQAEGTSREFFRAYYTDFVSDNDDRPRALDAHEQGISLQSLRGVFGSWFAFVSEMGGLSPEELAALEDASEFLTILETTPMDKSYKMVVLEAMLAREVLPGRIAIDALVDEFSAIARQSTFLRGDVGEALDDLAALRSLVLSQPVKAWVEGRGTRGIEFFASADDIFGTTARVSTTQPIAFRELVRELVELRIAQYADRERERRSRATSHSICKVIHSGGNPILMLDRARNTNLPEGATEILIDGERYVADFVKIALNVVKRPGQTENVLPEILQGFFGENVGRPGTRFRVVFIPTANGLVLEPFASSRLRVDENLDRP